MLKIFAIVVKEWKLLIRDIIGLLILFVLPMCLVMFLSISQAHQLDDSQKITLLVANQDKSTVGDAIVKAIRKSDKFTITSLGNVNHLSLADAKKKVAKGEYQSLLVIPKDITKQINSHNRSLARRRSTKKFKPQELQLFINPGMPGAFADSLKLSMQYILNNVEYQILNRFTQKVLRLRTKPTDNNLLTLTSAFPGAKGQVLQPNSVQQNVPAWTLFGMFFIVIPLAGTMVRERSQGVSERLRVAPVSMLTIQMGRVLAYVALNMVQFLLMLSVGVYILPMFGLPQLNLFAHIGPVIVIGLCASLAATGFGILVGTWVNTYQQATVLGPFIIVILAAIGGIFVPQYLMPKSLVAISNLSPMHWAQSAFIDIFIRNAQLNSLLTNIAKLLVFFVVTILLSMPPFTNVISHKKISG